MKTLYEIKTEISKKRGYNSFRNMHPNMVLFEELSDVIAERYAQQRVNEVLDRAVDASHSVLDQLLEDGVNIIDADFDLIREEILKLKP